MGSLNSSRKMKKRLSGKIKSIRRSKWKDWVCEEEEKVDEEREKGGKRGGKEKKSRRQNLALKWL